MTKTIKRHLLASVAAAVLFSVANGALAEQRTFNIPAAEATKAVPEFARQSGVQVIAPGDQLRGVQTRAVKGQWDVRAALATMLSSTGLQIASDDGATIVLRRFPSSTSADSSMDQQPTSHALEELVVTGTRILRDGFNSAGPIQTVGERAIEQLGYVSLETLLQQSPAIGVGLNSSATWRNGDAGASLANLRGLGVNRTLVLVNGRRRVSGSNLTSAVDLNSIPADMVGRTEIITGGASAIYGADAVSGVLNIITKKDADGLTLTARGGVSSRGDAGERAFGLFGGTTFAAGRGSVQIGATYSHQDGLLIEDRPAPNLRFQPNPANKGPADGVADNITIDARYPYINPDVNFYIGNRMYAVTTSGIRPINLGKVIASGSRATTDGGEGSTSIDGLHLRMPVKAVAARSDISYEITPNINFSFQGEFAKTWSHYNDDFFRYDERAVWLTGRGGPVIQLDNYYLPRELRDLMVANGLPQATARKQSPEFGYRRSYHDRTIFTGSVGLNGTLFERWDWNVFYQYGEFTDDIRNTNRLIASRYLNAVDVIADPTTGAPTCRNLTARAQGCVPYNVFDRKPLTSAQLAYLGHTRLQYAANTQSLYGGQLTGDLFRLPAGAIKIALGMEGRRETLTTRDDWYTLSGEGDHTDTKARLPVDASFRVVEGFGEIAVPILRDQPLFRRLDLDAAIRISNYNTIGTTTTYRAGLNWAVNDSLRLRASHARSVRAPNLLELYSPGTLSSATIVGPCDRSRVAANANRIGNCRTYGYPTDFVDARGGTNFVTSGNTVLKPETSNSFTVGAVITPEWLHGFSLSVDYWDIRIDDAVSSFTGPEIADRCFDGASLQSSFCRRLTIGTDLNIKSIDTSSLNVGRSRASGIDVGARLAAELGDGSTVRADLQGTYLIDREELVVADDPSTLFVRDGRYTDPRFRGNLTLSYDRGLWGGAVGLRFISASNVDPQASSELYDNPNIPSRTYTDITMRYQVDRKVSIYVGVRNAFDIDPPLNPYTYLGGATTAAPGAAVYYDTVGRFMHGGLKVGF